ncbi:MAG: Calx-beta domain-containing protein, partial [Anaerolineae bacterium]
GRDVSVDYTTSDDSATAGQDYSAATGETLTIPAGQTSGLIQIPLIDDVRFERDETLTLTLSNANYATLIGNQATGTITDNDDPPQIGFSHDEYRVFETDGPAILTVTLSGATQLTATVDYASGDGSATADDDYTPISGSLVFTPGVLTHTLPLAIHDDNLDELDETVLLTLTQPTSATLATATAVLLIVDNEGEPTLSIADAAAGESDGILALDVSLSFASDQDVSVDYATHDGPPGPGGATAGADYTETHGILTIPAGSLEGQIEVDIQSDNVYEGDEVLAVELSDPAHASLTDALAQGTIVDDDSPPTIAFQAADYAVGEGEAGGYAAITVTLSGATALTATVGYDTQDGTAGPADYISATGTLTLPAGTSTATLHVDLLDDPLYELDETFLVTLRDPLHAKLGDAQATATIVDDDEPPQIAFETDLYLVDEEAVTATLTVTLSGPTAVTATVGYATTDGPPPAGAQAGEDYVPISGTLTFQAGETQQAIAIPLLDDTQPEVSETIIVTLGNPVHSTIGERNPATVRLYDPLAHRIYLPLTLRQAGVTAQTGPW